MWLRRLLKKEPPQLLCVFCGAPQIEWPRYFTQELFEEHSCPSGRGHFFTSEPWVAARMLELR